MGAEAPAPESVEICDCTGDIDWHRLDLNPICQHQIDATVNMASDAYHQRLQVSLVTGDVNAVLPPPSGESELQSDEPRDASRNSAFSDVTDDVSDGVTDDVIDVQ